MWAKYFSGLSTVLKVFLVVLGVGMLILILILSKWKKRLQANRANSWKIALLIRWKTLISGYPAIYARWIIAQAKGESDSYGSRLAREQNNIFGLRCATVRDKYYTDCVNNYAKYNSVYDSIRDYFDLMHFNGLPNDLKDVKWFAVWLKNKRYYETSVDTYTRMIESHLS